MVCDPFALLGCTYNSTPAEARAAYRTLALLTHPDRNGGLRDQFELVQLAYEWVHGQLEASIPTGQVTQAFEQFALERAGGVDVPPLSALREEEYAGEREAFASMWAARNEDSPEWGAFPRGGYADTMVPHGAAGEPRSYGRQELVEYKEPSPIVPLGLRSTCPLDPVAPPGDYTTPEGTDYVVAFSEPAPLLEPEPRVGRERLGDDRDAAFSEIPTGVSGET